MLMAVLSNPVMAEPSGVTRYLIDEPVSMMDFALYRLTEIMFNYHEKLSESLQSLAGGTR